MLTKNHARLTAEVAKHIEADAVVQRHYWENGKGCFIGCLAHSPDAETLGEIYGLPLPLVNVCESIFEGLPLDQARAFFAALPEAVGRDGKDLTRVHWAFLASELRALPEVPAETQAAIDLVIAGMDLLAAGEDWPPADAASDAAYAARAAARAADAAAYADAAAAAAARGRQRDTILRLIAQAA